MEITALHRAFQQANNDGGPLAMSISFSLSDHSENILNILGTLGIFPREIRDLIYSNSFKPSRKKYQQLHNEKRRALDVNRNVDYFDLHRDPPPANRWTFTTIGLLFVSKLAYEESIPFIFKINPFRVWLEELDIGKVSRYGTKEGILIVMVENTENSDGLILAVAMRDNNHYPLPTKFKKYLHLIRRRVFVVSATYNFLPEEEYISIGKQCTTAAAFLAEHVRSSLSKYN